jgi:hypothetical protein
MERLWSFVLKAVLIHSLSLCLSPSAALHRLRRRVPRCLRGVRHYSALVDRTVAEGNTDGDDENLTNAESESESESERSTGSTVLNSKEHNIRQKTSSLD